MFLSFFFDIINMVIKMIGIILKNIRKVRNFTQEEIGLKLNVAKNTISNYETEYSSPNFDTIKEFLDLCEFEIQFIDKKNNKLYKLEELSKEMDF